MSKLRIWTTAAAIACTLGALGPVQQASAGGGSRAVVRPARRPARPAPSARASAYRAAKRKLIARGKGFVRGGSPRWIAAERLKGRVSRQGGIRLRALRRARLVTVYVPEVQGGVEGFRVERLYGMADGAAGQSGDEVGRVETAYGTAVATMADQHLSEPTPTELHDRAVHDIEEAPDAADPIQTGRRGIAAVVGGRDRWTRYQTPDEYKKSEAKTNRAPEESVTAKRTRDGFAVVKLSSFTSSVAKKIAEELSAERPRGVVLDLRGNGGGLVAEARQLLELFAVDDRVMLIERTRKGGTEKVDEWRAGGPGAMAGVPLVVLVDGDTASASEIVTASLKDTGSARIGGTKTFGKGVKQLPTPLEDGSAIRVTFGKIEGPKTRWHDVGIDVDVSDGELAARGRRAFDGDGASGGDPVLAGALDELRSLASSGR